VVKRICFFFLLILAPLFSHHTAYSLQENDDKDFGTLNANLLEAEALEKNTVEKEPTKKTDENIEINMDDLFDELNELDEKEKIEKIKISLKDRVLIFWALPLSQKAYLFKEHVKKHKIAYGTTAAIILFGTVYFIVRKPKKSKKKKK